MFPGEDGRPDPSTVRPFLTFGGLNRPAVDIGKAPKALFYINLFGPRLRLRQRHRPPDRLLLGQPAAGGAADRRPRIRCCAACSPLRRQRLERRRRRSAHLRMGSEDSGSFVSGSSKAGQDRRRQSQPHGDRARYRQTRCHERRPGNRLPRRYAAQTKIVAPLESLIRRRSADPPPKAPPPDAEEGSLLPTSLGAGTHGSNTAPHSYHVAPAAGLPLRICLGHLGSRPNTTTLGDRTDP